MKILFFCLCACSIFPFLEASSIDCSYTKRTFEYLKYTCEVSNNINISSSESAFITDVNGAHLHIHNNNDEIYFYAEGKHIKYFPQGLEKFFTNLAGIIIVDSKLEEITNYDLKRYKNLKYLNLSKNNIEVIEDGLFDYYHDIEVIIFDLCNIFHITSTVFDNLPKLRHLSLLDNKCINKKYEKNQKNESILRDVISFMEKHCANPDYLKLENKLKNLEEDLRFINFKNLALLSNKVKDLKVEIQNSNLTKSFAIKQRLFQFTVIELYGLQSKVENLENSVKKMMSSDNAKIQNSLMIIMVAVVGSTMIR